METLEFLNYILPTKGFKFLALQKTADKPPVHKAFESFELMARGIEHAARTGTTVYHACSSFKEEKIDTGELNSYGNPRYRYRIQENAAFVKALWLDLDCGEGKDYPSQSLAITAVIGFIKSAGLPSPLIVNSGYGVHAYWGLTEEIPATQWVTVAANWRAVVDHFKLKHDPACTTDICRILRPVGSHNNKRGEAKGVVTVGRIPELINTRTMVAKIMAIVREKNLSIITGKRPQKSTLNNDLSLPAEEYPPADADDIASHCAQVGAFKASGGDVSEPTWYAMLGLVKHAVNGEDICHEWSSGVEDYRRDVTQRKIDQWAHGPTTCAKFEALNPAGCVGCPHKGRVVSPIQLGTVAPEPEPIEEVVEATQTVERMPEIPVSMREKFSWSGTKLCAYMKDEDTGVRKAVPICSHYMFARQSHRKHVGGEHAVHIVWVVRDKPGIYREFELAGDSVGVGGKDLFSALGRQGIVAYTGGKRPMEQYISEWYRELRESAEEVNSYSTFGWHGDDFLLGTTLITPNGVQENIRVQGDTAKYAAAFEPQGDIEFWKQGIDDLYNKPNHEQYQWTFGTGFGAPLIHLWGGGMAGCVIHGYSAETGFGKSTAGKLGLGLYGNPEKLTLTKQQTTTKGLFAYCGMMKSLPILLDEVTNSRGLELSETVYTFSQGTGRLGAQSDGSLRNNVYEWATLLLTNANKAMHVALASVKGDASPEIARVFDYQFSMPSNQMSKSEADDLVPELFKCSGLAGRVYMEYVVSHKDEVCELMVKTRKAITTAVDAKAGERYWVAGATVVICGLMIARKLGLVKFDMGNLYKWALRQLVAMRGQLKETTIDITEHFGAMLNDMAPSFLVTDREGDSRQINGRAVVIHAPRTNTLLGRVLNDTKTLYIPVSVIRSWCAENQVDYKNMIDTLTLKQWATVGTQPYALGRGTADYATAPSRCMKIDMALAGAESASIDTVTKLTRAK